MTNISLYIHIYIYIYTYTIMYRQLHLRRPQEAERPDLPDLVLSKGRFTKGGLAKGGLAIRGVHKGGPDLILSYSSIDLVM